MAKSNYMPLRVPKGLSDLDLPAIQKVLLGRILVLTRNGERACTYSNEQGIKDTGCSRRTIIRNITALQSQGFVTFKTVQSGGKWDREVTLSESFLTLMRECQEGDKLEEESVKDGVKESAKESAKDGDRQCQNDTETVPKWHCDSVKMTPSFIYNTSEYTSEYTSDILYEKIFSGIHKKAQADFNDRTKPWEYHPEIVKAWFMYNAESIFNDPSDCFVDNEFKELEPDLANLLDWLNENIIGGLYSFLNIKYPNDYEGLALRIARNFDPDKCKSPQAYVTKAVVAEARDQVKIRWEEIYSEEFAEELDWWCSITIGPSKDFHYHPFRCLIEGTLRGNDHLRAKYKLSLPLLSYIRERTMYYAKNDFEVPYVFGDDPRAWFDHAVKPWAEAWKKFSIENFGFEVNPYEF